VSESPDVLLDRDVVEQLKMGNWPVCPHCDQERRDHTLQYVGIVFHAATFMCETCSLVFAMNLGDAPE
jgi:rubredoxin